MDYPLEKRTKIAFIGISLADIPFWTLLSLLTFILYKSMHITPLQVTCITIIKPISSLFAPYWSQRTYERPDRVLSNLAWGNTLRYLPFLFVPWINSAWIIILAFGLYMMFHRAGFTTWIETIKTNMSPTSRERLMGSRSALNYGLIALLPFALGPILDKNPESWRWLFPGTATLGLMSTFFLYLISPYDRKIPSTAFPKINLLEPWKKSWELIKKDINFLNFQIGFMLGGAGLMIMHLIIPTIFVDVLNLSYTNMLLATSVFKSLGFALTTPLWVRLFRKINIYTFCGLVATLIAIFPFLLLTAQFHILLLYCAYAIYGIMQAGSEFSWHMSGPIFAKEKDSTVFTSTNVLAVGIRSCIILPLGTLLFSLTNSVTVLIAGSLLGILAAAYFMRCSAAIKTEKEAM
jgi:MFS family permease